MHDYQKHMQRIKEMMESGKVVFNTQAYRRGKSVYWYNDNTIHPKSVFTSEQNNCFIIDGECEDITDRRTLPELKDG